MSVRKRFYATLVLSTLTLNSWAQQSCPLTNSKLTDLRTAASKLATNIVLSPACKAYEGTVNQANADLQNIANQITSNDADGASADKTALAMNAITQLNNINSIFNHDRCGQELAGFLDYADSFIDVANGMAPFLAIYGGPAAMPWVLGAALGGAAVKSLISFFNDKTIDMRNPDQSNAFIKNSCSFYNLDLIKNSIDDIQLQQSTRLEQALKESKAKLKALESSPPNLANSPTSRRLKLAQKDVERINTLQDQFKADPIEACVYIKAYANHEDSSDDKSLVERVWENYEPTIKNTSFRLELERNYFLNELNAAAAHMDSLQCKELGLRWLNKMASLSALGLENLEKLTSSESSTKDFETYTLEKKKAEETVKLLEAKVKYFEEMSSDGFNIEYSEIIRSHQQVQDALFDSYRYLLVLKMKGLAQAWLKVKNEDADLELKNFHKRKKEIDEKIEDLKEVIGEKNDLSPESVNQFASDYYQKNKREHPFAHRHVLLDVCNELRLTWSAWYNGFIHAQAGRDYCVTFDKVINQLDYPDVQKLCFGTSSRLGRKINSLKNQVAEFKDAKSEADAVLARMKALSCQGVKEVSPEIMSLSVI